MTKKTRSFADKAAKKHTKDVSYVKYVKSVRSEKTGYWRFNEQMLALRGGESLEAALKRLATQPLPEPVSPPAETVPSDEAPEEKEAPVALAGSAEDPPTGGQVPPADNAPGEAGPAPAALAAEAEPAAEKAPAETPATAE